MKERNVSKVSPERQVSHLPDADMQAVPKALTRAAQRAREIAERTGTELVVINREDEEKPDAKP